MSFYEKGPVRIRYEETGSGLPLLLIAGGGLNSTISGLTNPFNPIEEFKAEYRCIASDLRNANSGQSSGPLEVDRPWEAYADDGSNQTQDTENGSRGDGDGRCAARVCAADWARRSCDVVL